MQNISSTNGSYRHKKFDISRQQRLDLSLLKEELLHSGTATTCSYSIGDDESSNCSSDYSVSFPQKRRLLNTSTPLPKRNRPAEDSGLATDDTDSIKCESNESYTSNQLPNISPATLREIVKYHGNMVRTFPKVQRTPKDQERRNKNTIACRMSRRVKKLESLAIEQQYKEFAAQHLKIVEQSIRARDYFNHLQQLSKSEPPKLTSKNFSIEYLIKQ